MITTDSPAPDNFSQFLAEAAAEYFPEFGNGAFHAGPVPADEGSPPLREAVSTGEAVSGAKTVSGVEAAHSGGTASGAEAAGYAPVVVPAGSEGGALRGNSPAEANGANAPDLRGRAEQVLRQTSPAGYDEQLAGRTIDSIRADFPLLSGTVEGRPLIWLDNAATTQKPRQVIERLTYYYEHENSNVHRAAHELAARSTNAYEEAREKVARFIGAPAARNIVWVRGTTEGINLVAAACVRPFLKEGDEIIVTYLEHHANIVPWQLIAQEKGAILRAAPVDDSGQIIIQEYARLFNKHTKFAAFTHVSNALGTITPVHEMVHIAHLNGVRTLIDAAQSVPHIPLNVSGLGTDFLVFSGHKIFGPTGIGVLYGTDEALEAAAPYQGGGNMIADVTFGRTQYQKAPAKFEAGTGNIADAVGLGAALDYVSGLGIAEISRREHELLRYGLSELRRIPGLRVIGSAPERTSALSFILDGHTPEETGEHLNRRGIAVRAGHHCAQPVHRRFGLEGTVRPSLAFYNTFGEIEALAKALRELA